MKQESSAWAGPVVNCCGVARSSAFCPDCGRRLRSPLSTLLEHLYVRRDVVTAARERWESRWEEARAGRPTLTGRRGQSVVSPKQAAYHFEQAAAEETRLIEWINAVESLAARSAVSPLTGRPAGHPNGSDAADGQAGAAAASLSVSDSEADGGG